MTLVSAVIPVHNGERFLADAIESVLAQTHAQVECVVVDDGSTDGTSEVIASFGPAVRSVRQERFGVAAARNAGIAMAAGELVALLDADDVWLPDKVERQVAAFSGHPDAGLCYTGYAVVDHGLGDARAVLPSPWPARVIGAISLESYGMALGSTAMFPRRVFEQVGGFDSTLSTSADLDFLWRVARTHPVSWVSQTLALYRQPSRSQMSQDLEALARDMTSIMGRALEDGHSRRRGLANLYTHLAFRHAQRGEGRAALRHAVLAARHDARRLVLLPAEALARRGVRAIAGQWPRRPALDGVGAVLETSSNVAPACASTPSLALPARPR